MEKRNREHVYYTLTRGMCRTCRKSVDAKIIIRKNRVFQRNICPEHGASEALIAENAGRYLELARCPAVHRKPMKTSPGESKGCCRDCGPCNFHLQACNLPVFSITNACNMECPICFTFNRKDKVFFMEKAEFQQTLDRVVETCGPLDLINITGGEPTLHPQLAQLLEAARRPEIGRVTVNTNGLRLAEDSGLAETLAKAGVYVVLSFHTFDRQTSRSIHGRDVVDEKLKALEMLKRYSIPTTLLTVMARGVNEGEIGRIIDTAMNEEFIRSITVQTMTYTGFGGRRFQPRQHLPVDGAIAEIDRQTGGKIQEKDFLPLPSAHPLCYAVTYLLTDGSGEYIPLTRAVSRETLSASLQEGYLLHPSFGFANAVQEAIVEAWADDRQPLQSRRFLSLARKTMDNVFPAGRALSTHERQSRAERWIKTIYIHAHMDEDNFDIDRVRRCGDLVPDRGRLIPACAYNLFYRQQDERFWIPDET